jgi:methylenetetrahydrofolate reductase (NADPH)
MALRGDAPAGSKRFKAEPDGYSYSNELVAQIKAMNEGRYIDESIKDAVPTNFCIGVAGYPEKHFEAPNIEVDIANLKRKVDSGADYIITQMFFDNAKYFEFLDKCREKGITVPIIPGLKPLSLVSHLTKLPETFSIDIPQDLVRLVNDCKDEGQVYQLGIEWCVAQSKELIAKGVPAIHYYTMGRGNNVTEVLKRVF